MVIAFLLFVSSPDGVNRSNTLGLLLLLLLLLSLVLLSFLLLLFAAAAAPPLAFGDGVGVLFLLSFVDVVFDPPPPFGFYPLSSQKNSFHSFQNVTKTRALFDGTSIMLRAGVQTQMTTTINKVLSSCVCSSSSSTSSNLMATRGPFAATATTRPTWHRCGRHHHRQVAVMRRGLATERLGRLVRAREEADRALADGALGAAGEAAAWPPRALVARDGGGVRRANLRRVCSRRCCPSRRREPTRRRARTGRPPTVAGDAAEMQPRCSRDAAEM